MTQNEYEQKKRECWRIYAGAFDIKDEIPNEAFNWVFDRAYALGKETGTITQEDVEKAAGEYVYERQKIRHYAKRDEDATMRDFDKTIKAWDAYDMEQAFKSGANLFLGKQEKDADTVTVDKEEYDKLCKRSRYIANWVPSFRVCPICGEYNPSGCICANCDNNKDWNK